MAAPDAQPTTSPELLGVAIGHATLRVPVADPSQRAGAVREKMAGEEFDSASSVVVLEHGRLVGLLPMERLLAAAPDTPLSAIMDTDLPVVGPGVDQELAAWEMVRRNESNLAVVDRDGRFQGLVPAQRMLAVLLEEHDEDLARLGGYLAGTRSARAAAEERISRRLLHRLPWLILGLAGAMASAVIVGAFEAQLDSVVLLAFFLPAVVYMADAVGTQTETVLIRGLSVGIRTSRVLWREAATGVVIGLLIALLFFPFALIGWGEVDVALSVSVALFASCGIATVVAMALPLLLVRLGRDPAFGSGPLATILQDLLSIAVYLGVATPIAT
jgi:magnesium transporter